MSVIGSNILAGASGQGGGYNLTRSLRFRESATAYLNRTQTAGDRQKFTLSLWVKYSVGSYNSLYSATSGSISDYFRLGFVGNGSPGLNFGRFDGSGTVFEVYTNASYRDPSAWYHIILSVDTTQATSSNRVKIYVNGSQVTLAGTYPTQNTNLNINSNSVVAQLGAWTAVSQNFDGYMTEVNFIDGQALTPSSFGENNTDTGVWQPKQYVGTYGTNGFYLPFTDNSALTTSSNVGLGKDFSGNGNYWTTNNISITSGATYDSMTDVPTLTSATASNFAVMNPLDKSSNVAISNGNLTTAWGGSTIANIRGTFELPTTGKYYWEALFSGTAQGSVGVAAANMPLGSVASGTYISYAESGLKYVNGSSSGYGSTYGSGDLIGIAYDADSAQITFYKNNTSQGAISLTANTTYFPLAVHYNTTINFNFGQRPFAYTPPTGFVRLNTFNLPTPTIGATASTQANKYFDINLYTANGTGQTLTNSGGMQPDFAWFKSRSNAFGHALIDSVRGVSKVLTSNATSAEDTSPAGADLLSFNSNGVTLGTGYYGSINDGTSSNVLWQWKANGTGVTNTAGSITSTVSANTTAGFSIVTYTGTGSNATVGHGLGVAPKMYIVKNRNSGGTYWGVYHTSIPASQAVYLNVTSAASTNTVLWNSTAPTSSVFSVGTSSDSNESGWTYVAYCFSDVQGYQKCGNFTASGSADGTFVHLGFRPRYIMIKQTNSTSNWFVHDTARSTYNVADKLLRANLSDAELTPSTTIDFLSNGFKIRDSGFNGSYIYLAIAETPAKFSLAR